MEYKKTIPLALLVCALSFMLLMADNIIPASALTITSVTGLTNVRNAVPYTTGVFERVFVLHSGTPMTYSVYQYSNSTGTPTLNLFTSGSIVINGVNAVVLQNYVEIAEDSARLWFGVRNGTGAQSGFIVSFTKATNALNYYSVGRCAPVSVLMVGSELFTSSLQAGSSGSICGDTRQLVSWDTNLLSTSLTVNTPVWDSGASESGYLSTSPTTNTIVLCETSPASPRIQPINYVTHTLGTRFGSGTSPYNGGCVSDGSFVYGLRGDGTIDKFTGSAMTTSGWKSGIGTPVDNTGVNMAYKSGQLYASSSNGIYNIKTSDASTLATYPNNNANAMTLSSRGVFYYVSTTTVNRVLDGAPSGGSGGSGGVDTICSDPANINLLICRIENEGGALVGSSDLLNQTGTNISCMVGIISCTQDENGNFVPDNPDIQTNGVGYLLTVVAIGVMIAIMWVASRGQLVEIPTFIWFIGTLAIVGATTVMGWIDPTFLVITIIAVVAMAVAKAKGVFGDRAQLFAGEG